MKKYFFFITCCVNAILGYCQTNIISTNSIAEQVLLCNFTPSTYFPSPIINQHDLIVQGLTNEINTDSIHSYLLQLSAFQNRNSGSDTTSASIGIGAARRWAFDKFTEFSSVNQNRLIPSYLQFDMQICNMFQHRNIFAVLPGTQKTDSSVIVIEAHIDSRCEGPCDSLCIARGMEDNGSGCALVLELARVMSKYAFNNTIVFLLTIGEEQGLYGANAFALYCQQNHIPVKCVQNNDIVGGIICGQTSSPPGCPGLNDIDSSDVRIFSVGTFLSPQKAYARFCKLEYLEEALPFAPIPTTIHIMTPEDRTGRGGDHIPFDALGYTAVRFTSANEHGDADVSVAGYSDRQHSVRDILGVDTDSNGSIDSFYVDFDYLKRNTVINGTAAAMAGIGPHMPAFTYTNDGAGITVTVSSQTQYKKYRVSQRRNASNYDLDQVYAFSDTLSYCVPAVKKDSIYYISMASIDSNGVESLFTIEQKIKAVADGPLYAANISVPSMTFTISPNPNAGKMEVKLFSSYQTEVVIAITDILGRSVMQKKSSLSPGDNLIPFELAVSPGIYNLSIFSKNNFAGSKRIVICN